MVGVAQSHGGDRDLVHSGHDDSIDGTLSAKGFKYLKARTFRYVVPAGAFIPESASSDLGHGGGSAQVNLTQGEAIAGVSLPVGSTIRKIEMFTSDDSNPVAVELQEVDQEGNIQQLSVLNATNNDCGGEDIDYCRTSDSSIDDPGTQRVEGKIRGNRHYGLYATGTGILYKVLISYKTRSLSTPPGTG